MPYAVNAGTKIYYQVAGDGPVVVLMHGIGSTGEVWHELGAVERFAANFTVVTIDARGLGRSDRPTVASAYTRKLRRDDTIAVLDEIGAGQAHLVGYSLGARTAFYIATDRPDRVASVVAGGANPFPSAVNLELTSHLRTVPPRPPKYVRAYLRLRRMLIRPARDQTVAALLRQAEPRAFDVDAAVAAMTMPVYLFSGEFDESFAVELTRDFAERLADARLEIVPGENHGMLRRIQPLLPKIEEFLLRVSAPTT